MMYRYSCKKCNIEYWEDDENKAKCPMCKLKTLIKTIYITANQMTEHTDCIKYLIKEYID